MGDIAAAAGSRVAWTFAGFTLLGGFAVTLSPGLFQNLAMAGTALGLLWGARRYLSPSFLSPVHVTTLGLTALAVFGGLFYRGGRDPGILGAAVHLSLSEQTWAATVRLLLVAAIAVAAGGALCGVLFSASTHDEPQLRGVTLPPVVNRMLLPAGCVAVLVTLVASFGWHDLIERPLYIREHVQQRPLYSVALQLGTAAVLAVGYLFASNRRYGRLGAVVLAAGFVTVFFGLGSRRLALIPVLFALGAYGANPQRKGARGWLLVSLATSALLVRVALYLRGEPGHGVLPYWHALPGALSDDRVTWQAVALNLLIGFALTGQTAFESAPIASHDLWVSINPLPGGFSGWYDIAASHRLNRFSPYSAIGELGNAGALVTVLYFLAAGMVLAYLDRRMRSLIDAGKQLYGLAFLGMATLFVLFSMQYNLRAATRVLYYSIALDIAIRLFLAAGRRSTHPAPE